MIRSLHKRFLAFGLAGLLGCTSCQLLWSPSSPRNYILRRPEKILLDTELREISGLCYLKPEHHLLAVAYDKHTIYSLSTAGKLQNYYNANLPSAGFEDVVKVDSTVYTLVSNGTIIAINKTDSGFTFMQYPFWSAGKNDFESLYYDSAAKGLVILCKSCAFENKHVHSAYRLDLATKQFDRQPLYTINAKTVRDILKDGKVNLSPTAVAVHPIEKRLYILSTAATNNKFHRTSKKVHDISSGNLLVITSMQGRVEEAYRLNPFLYTQPEGIAFATNGDMYVSNEAKMGKPTLLKIAYKNHPKNY